MPAAIEATALVKRYRSFFGFEHEAVADLTLSISVGVTFGLLGPNGAGKTTFIKLLLGVVQATSGSVRVLGGDPQDAAIRARIGYLPERMHLPSALRATDFLRSVATLKMLKVTASQLKAMLERVGLRDSTQRIGSFSKGMRQRLGLAAAMLGQPELLILDEPTDGIDPVGRTQVRALLLEEKARGATILLNSHLLSETEKVCDRIGILSQGRLKREGPLQTLRAERSQWQVRFEGAEQTPAILAAGFEVAEGGFAFTGSVEGLNVAIDNARRAEVRLISLQPDAKSLEEVLTETLSVEGQQV